MSSHWNESSAVLLIFLHFSCSLQLCGQEALARKKQPMTLWIWPKLSVKVAAVATFSFLEACRCFGQIGGMFRQPAALTLQSSLTSSYPVETVSQSGATVGIESPGVRSKQASFKLLGRKIKAEATQEAPVGRQKVGHETGAAVTCQGREQTLQRCTPPLNPPICFSRSPALPPTPPLPTAPPPLPHCLLYPRCLLLNSEAWLWEEAPYSIAMNPRCFSKAQRKTPIKVH